MHFGTMLFVSDGNADHGASQYYKRYGESYRCAYNFCLSLYYCTVSDMYLFVQCRVTLFFLGESVKHEFQSETQMLLQIVAKSLYSDKEVTISNTFGSPFNIAHIVSTIFSFNVQVYILVMFPFIRI